MAEPSAFAIWSADCKQDLDQLRGMALAAEGLAHGLLDAAAERGEPDAAHQGMAWLTKEKSGSSLMLSDKLAVLVDELGG